MNEINRYNILKSIEPRFKIYVENIDLNLKNENLKEAKKYISTIENIMNFIDSR